MATNKGDMCRKLGQLLVERGCVSGTEVMRAIVNQRAQGGRLGTSLLELQMVREEQLLDILSEQQGVPAAVVDRLRHIPEKVIEMIPRRVAERCRAVPFAVSERHLDVAAVNARDLGSLDELAFCTNRRVRAHVASEVRIVEALANYYGVDCPQRFEELLNRLNELRDPFSPRRETPAPPEANGNGASGNGGAAHAAAEEAFDSFWQDPDEVFGSLPEAAREEVPRQGTTPSDEPREGPPRATRPTVLPRLSLSWPEAREAALPEGAPPQGAPPPAAIEPVPGTPEELLWGWSEDPPSTARYELELGDVDRLLKNVTDAAGIGEILLRYMRQRFHRVALFKVHPDSVRPWLSHGATVDHRLFRALLIQFREPSVFLNLHQGSTFHLGPLPPMPVHRQLVRCFRDEWPKECLLMPVRIGGRLVTVLYGDREKEGLAGLFIEEWRQLAALAADALELCILRKKLRAS